MRCTSRPARRRTMVADASASLMVRATTDPTNATAAAARNAAWYAARSTTWCPATKWLVPTAARTVATRPARSSFADCARQLVLPDVGYQIHVPSFLTGGSTDIDDLELIGLPTDSPTTGYVADPVNVEQGKGLVWLSQRMLDRGQGPDGQGGNFDVLLADQIGEQLRYSINQQVLTQALANAATVIDNTSLTTSLWWGDLNTAVEKLADANLLVGFVGRLTKMRPIFTADIGAVVASPPVNEPFCSTGWQGLKWAGSGGAWFVDDGIANSTANATAIQVLVWNASSVWFGNHHLRLSLAYQTEAVRDR